MKRFYSSSKRGYEFFLCSHSLLCGLYRREGGGGLNSLKSGFLTAIPQVRGGEGEDTSARVGFENKVVFCRSALICFYS